MYVTIQFPPGVSHYTDQWHLDPKDAWNGADFLAQVCDELLLNPTTWRLEKGGAELPATEPVFDVLIAGDVVALVAV